MIKLKPIPLYMTLASCIRSALQPGFCRHSACSVAFERSSPLFFRATVNRPGKRRHLEASSSDIQKYFWYFGSAYIWYSYNIIGSSSLTSLQGCTKRLFPGCVNNGQKIVLSCLQLVNKTHLIHPNSRNLGRAF